MDGLPLGGRAWNEIAWGPSALVPEERADAGQLTKEPYRSAFFFFFNGHTRHVEVPGLGMELELQLLPVT